MNFLRKLLAAFRFAKYRDAVSQRYCHECGDFSPVAYWCGGKPLCGTCARVELT